MSMEGYMDEQWKLSKKGTSKGAKARTRTRSRTRSRSSMARSISRRCVGLVREQRARFYIMRRCVTMLLCWRDYA